ncbi:MAG: HEAT repeat domain-containing protein [Spirochaetaceae bacterium]|jgi:HEAT repeat protein|nr:HEAT repeat domain-containing protein [Spirochaetaceae bacterium]
MKKVFIIYCLLFNFFTVFAQEKDAPTDNENVQRETLRYGTDSEIAVLIQTLKKTKAEYLDAELAELVSQTKNPQIKSAVITFFSERGKSGLENEAIYLIENRDTMESANVRAAINYLGKVKYENGQNNLRAVLEAGEESYVVDTIKAIGRAVGEQSADSAAEYLINYYQTKTLSDDAQRELVTALGETASKQAAPFLIDIVNENPRVGLTTAALLSLALIKDESALEVIIAQVESKDPAIRSSAVEALGNFSGPSADKAVIDAFRDSYYKTRIAAIKAAGAKKSEEALPYLKFRVENDEVQVVKEEAIKALGAIGNSSADILEAVFKDKKTSDKNRILSAEMLVKINGDNYVATIIEKIDESKRLNQKQLYNGLLGALSKAKSEKLQAFTSQLFASKDASDKAFGLELTGNNLFRSFIPEVEKLADDQNSGLARKAKEVLEKFQGGETKPQKTE